MAFSFAAGLWFLLEASAAAVATGASDRTAYLWEEVLQRDSLLDLLARFILAAPVALAVSSRAR